MKMHTIPAGGACPWCHHINAKWWPTTGLCDAQWRVLGSAPVREALKVTKAIIRLCLILGCLTGCSGASFTLDSSPDPTDPTDTPTVSDTSDPPDATPLADSGQTLSDGPQDGPGDGKSEATSPDSGLDTHPDLGADTAPETSEVCTGKPLGEDCMIAEPKSCCSGKCVTAGGCCGIGKCVL